MAACRTRRIWPWIAGAIGGCLLITFSFVGKLMLKPEQAWPPEKATEYTQVGMKLHKLSYEMRPARGPATRPEELRKLSAARDEYQQTKSHWEALREELETAKKHGQIPLDVLRWTGAALGLFCLVGWLATRPSQ